MGSPRLPRSLPALTLVTRWESLAQASESMSSWLNRFGDQCKSPAEEALRPLGQASVGLCRGDVGSNKRGSVRCTCLVPPGVWCPFQAAWPPSPSSGMSHSALPGAKYPGLPRGASPPCPPSTIFNYQSSFSNQMKTLMPRSHVHLPQSLRAPLPAPPSLVVGHPGQREREWVVPPAIKFHGGCLLCPLSSPG